MTTSMTQVCRGEVEERRRRVRVRKRPVGLVAAATLAAALFASRRAGADDELASRRIVEHTAFTVGKGDLKLGVLSFDYGLTDWLAIGTDPPAWAARAVIDTFLPNLHLKATPWRRERAALSLQAAGYWASLNASDDIDDGSVFVVPLSAFASFGVTKAMWLHLESTYNFVEATGSGNFNRLDLDGAVSTRALQFGAVVDYHFTRVFALRFRGRVQAATSPVAIEGDSQIDPFTTASVNANVDVYEKYPWMASGGIALTWKYVRLAAGVGYGNYFIPGLNIPTADTGIIPDGTIYVIF